MKDYEFKPRQEPMAVTKTDALLDMLAFVVGTAAGGGAGACLVYAVMWLAQWWSQL